jgi:hypothetical protein
MPARVRARKSANNPTPTRETMLGGRHFFIAGGLTLRWPRYRPDEMTIEGRGNEGANNMTMAANEPVFSGRGYTVTEVDGRPPTGLARLRRGTGADPGHERLDPSGALHRDKTLRDHPVPSRGPHRPGQHSRDLAGTGRRSAAGRRARSHPTHHRNTRTHRDGHPPGRLRRPAQGNP